MSGNNILGRLTNCGFILSIREYHTRPFLTTCLFSRMPLNFSRYCFAFGYSFKSMILPFESYGFKTHRPLGLNLLPVKSFALMIGNKSSFSILSLNSVDIYILSAPVATPMPTLNPCSSMVVKLSKSSFTNRLSQLSSNRISFCSVDNGKFNSFRFLTVVICTLLSALAFKIWVIAGYAKTDSLKTSNSSTSIMYSNL